MLIQNPPVAVTESLWMLGTNPYPLYLIKGQGAGAIVEGGTGAMGPLVREQLEQLGIGPDFVKQLIITHAHPDHVMAVPLLTEMFPGVAILGSEVSAQALAAEKTMGFFRQMDDLLTESLLKAGTIDPRHRPASTGQGQPIAVSRVLRDGDRIAIDGVTLEVLATPGHSPCSLSFFDPGRKVLLASDATGYYLPGPDFWWPNYFADYGQYMDSMRRLAGVGAEILCLSHNAVIRGAEDVAAYFRGAIAATEQYHRRILAEGGAGKPGREIAEQRGAEVYQRTLRLSLDFFQKNCGLLVKLSLRAG